MDMTTYQIVTNLSCNLDCTYCYERKNTQANTVVDIIDFITACFDSDKDRDDLKTVVVDFIGGESFMRPDLVEAAFETANALGLRDKRRVLFSVSSNGTLFHKSRVQQLIEKWGSQLSVGISLDGKPHVHDKYRVFATDGSGSYDEVIEGIKYIDGKVYDLGFKATFTKDTLNNYAESMCHILDICSTLKGGFSSVAGNVVFEDILDKEMAPMIAGQMIAVIDKWVEYGFHLRNNCELAHFTPGGIDTSTFFDKTRVELLHSTIDIASVDPDRVRPYCGAVHHMKCLGFDRKVYGCNRFMTSFPDDAIIANLVGQSLVPVTHTLGKEIDEQFSDYPEECQRCPIKMMCGSCAAAPYENKDGTKSDRREYHAEKRQCGWTFAKVFAFEYWHRLFGTYDYKDQVEPCKCPNCTGGAV